MTQERERQVYAKDLVVGQTFGGAPSQIGDEQFSAFAKMTGDNHPIHYDEAFAAKTRFGKRLAHGLLLVSMSALGATPMSARLEDAMVAFVEQSFRFLKPVFIGDEVSSRFEVAKIDRRPGRSAAMVSFNVSLVNRDGEAVLQGHHTYLLLWTAPDSEEKVESHAV